MLLLISEATVSPETVRLNRWQIITISTLFTGYAGYYICRSNLSIAAPLLLDEYGSEGLTKEHIGFVSSVGVLFYAGGKLLNDLGIAGGEQKDGTDHGKSQPQRQMRMCAQA